jgi:hypothetical protein
MRTRTIFAAAAAPAALAAVLLGTTGASAATVTPATTTAAVVKAAHEWISPFGGGHGAALPVFHKAYLYDPNNASYSGLTVHHTAKELPKTAPTFSYTELGTPSGGAPRVVFTMSNGDQVTEYATPAVADGTTANVAGQFDVQNGPSGYHYNVPWTQVLSMEAGQTIKSEQLVSDTYTGPTFVVITGWNDGTATLIG